MNRKFPLKNCTLQDFINLYEEIETHALDDFYYDYNADSIFEEDDVDLDVN